MLGKTKTGSLTHAQSRQKWYKNIPAFWVRDNLIIRTLKLTNIDFYTQKSSLPTGPIRNSYIKSNPVLNKSKGSNSGNTLIKSKDSDPN